MIEMVREKSGNLRTKDESQGIFTVCPDIKALPLLRFNLIISVSAKMLCREVLKTFLKSGKMKVKKVTTLSSSS